ncbi:transposase [Sphingomonas sp. AAP5]|uniref:transposase n=1 Tax=Sphingomonas sp. AAP5 TaxID=1523415 RepID=UPI0010575D92|nr:transposase [Sphingomonas sp. AAP5]QBM76553.1 transposase [Sphingomonas sp. AAP5]
MLSKAKWYVFRGLLPIGSASRGPGRPPEENRSIINRILWRLRCGAPWREVPPKYGNWNTIYRRFRLRSEAGVWEAVSVTLAEMMADSGHYSIHSTTIRAHVSAASRKGELIDARLAAHGAGSPVSFPVWQMPEDNRLPSTCRSAKRPIARPMKR